jgi:lycopene beta-cyclase
VDEAGYAEAILDEARRRGWKVRAVVRRETGSLPIPLAAARTEGALLGIGVRGGFFHPVTGYSLPSAVRVADRLASLPPGPGLLRQVARALQGLGREQRHGARYLHFLSRMMFRAAAPHARLRVMEHFYRLPEASIARFYAGTLGWTDRLRILWGAPPVPIRRAVACVVPRRGGAPAS